MTLKNKESPTTCPFCGTFNPLVTNPTGDLVPKDGDISICWTCLEVAIFCPEAPGSLRKPTDDEYIAMARHKKLQLVLQTARDVRVKGQEPC